MRDVLWAVPVSDMGGVARHVRDVFAQGITGSTLNLLVPPGPLAELATAEGYPVITAPFGPEHGLGSSLRSLRLAVRETHATVIHSHLAYADFVAALAPMGTAARVSTEHGIAADDAVYHSSRFVSRAMALAHRVRLRRLDALIAVSHATERAIRYKWHPPARLGIVVVPNGVDRPSGVLASSKAGMHVVALARLAPEKGLLTLVDAFAAVARDHPEARLTIAGEGVMRDEIEARIRELGIPELVRCVGYVDGIGRLAPVHVMAQLSVWENCSYALLDALVAGCGVVATDVGGNSEIVPPQCLVPLGDVNAAAERIVIQGIEAGQRPALREGWPSVEDMCDALASVYERVAPR